ncbi:MAG: PadR family transcriptional regulator [Planctomycetota bacterium]
MKLEREMMRGAGPTAVLQLLTASEKYGYELVEALADRSGGVLAMGQSTLYPMLYNLEAKGLVKSRTVTADNGRPRRYYRLTAKGRKQLDADRQRWSALFDAMAALGITPPPPGAASANILRAGGAF